MSAYALFFHDHQGLIKNENPKATFGEISKSIASLWDNLDNLTKKVRLVEFYFYYFFYSIFIFRIIFL